MQLHPSPTMTTKQDPIPFPHVFVFVLIWEDFSSSRSRPVGPVELICRVLRCTSPGGQRRLLRVGRLRPRACRVRPPSVAPRTRRTAGAAEAQTQLPRLQWFPLLKGK